MAVNVLTRVDSSCESRARQSMLGHKENFPAPLLLCSELHIHYHNSWY